VIIKLSEALDVTVDYLLGKEQFGKYDKEAVERLQEIQSLDDNTRKTLRRGSSGKIFIRPYRFIR